MLVISFLTCIHKNVSILHFWYLFLHFFCRLSHYWQPVWSPVVAMPDLSSIAIVIITIAIHSLWVPLQRWVERQLAEEVHWGVHRMHSMYSAVHILCTLYAYRTAPNGPTIGANNPIGFRVSTGLYDDQCSTCGEGCVCCVRVCDGLGVNY